MCDELTKYDMFDGKIINASNFLKLIRKKLEEHRVDKNLTVVVSWNESTEA